MDRTKEQKIYSHLIRALDAWVDGAEDDGDEDTMIDFTTHCSNVVTFKFADGSSITAHVAITEERL